MDCIFCKIVAGRFPPRCSTGTSRSSSSGTSIPRPLFTFSSCPPQHLESVREIEAGNASLAGHMTVVANDMARREGVFEKGYRLAINCGDEGGQTVGHLHMHVLGGRQLSGQLG